MPPFPLPHHSLLPQEVRFRDAATPWLLQQYWKQQSWQDLETTLQEIDHPAHPNLMDMVELVVSHRLKESQGMHAGSFPFRALTVKQLDTLHTKFPALLHDE